ncbi:uncharacterized protein PHALS_08256 [Plasmopara halstedii]|uniref:Uncharacterized protein n=1 Tax=Plasmopara halstedii TaxID=4781 RepID=A0A0P1AD29_PLAHL|nr:uncharacterized protein PHALS_08256 [Plasmopara halstedii]CEG38168.1 hypothetical protein PHALS_08256 [Plasmopara halstedii]|eukprot:XP_024574537.1 hypothetical protein PHALS_08256 [Plasmopara halstedii]
MTLIRTNRMDSHKSYPRPGQGYKRGYHDATYCVAVGFHWCKNPSRYAVQHSITEVMQQLYFPHEKQRNPTDQFQQISHCPVLDKREEGRNYLLPFPTLFVRFLFALREQDEIDVKILF